MRSYAETISSSGSGPLVASSSREATQSSGVAKMIAVLFAVAAIGGATFAVIHFTVDDTNLAPRRPADGAEALPPCTCTLFSTLSATVDASEGLSRRLNTHSTVLSWSSSRHDQSFHLCTTLFPEPLHICRDTQPALQATVMHPFVALTTLCSSPHVRTQLYTGVQLRR